MISQAIGAPKAAPRQGDAYFRGSLHHGVPDSPWLRARDRSAEGEA